MRGPAQQLDWTWQMVRDAVLDRVLSNPEVRKIRADVERQAKAGELTARASGPANTGRRVSLTER